MSKMVVTRRYAYRDARIAVCDAHNTSEAAGVALGPVEHGLHWGRCDVCARIALVEELSFEEGVDGQLLIWGLRPEEHVVAARDTEDYAYTHGGEEYRAACRKAWAWRRARATSARGVVP